MSPTCMVPKSILSAPIQIISMVIPFIINNITGIIKDITRLTNRFVLIKSVLALSNLFSSVFSLLKARITGSPVRISLVTRFNRSTNFCINLNLGMASINNVPTKPRSRQTPKAIIQVIEVLVFNTFMTPPMARIGA